MPLVTSWEFGVQLKTQIFQLDGLADEYPIGGIREFSCCNSYSDGFLNYNEDFQEFKAIFFAVI